MSLARGPRRLGGPVRSVSLAIEAADRSAVPNRTGIESMFHVKQIRTGHESNLDHLPMQNSPKITSRRSSTPISPVIRPSSSPARRRSSDRNSASLAPSRTARSSSDSDADRWTRCLSRLGTAPAPIPDISASFARAAISASIPSPVIADTARDFVAESNRFLSPLRPPRSVLVAILQTFVSGRSASR